MNVEHCNSHDLNKKCQEDANYQKTDDVNIPEDINNQMLALNQSYFDIEVENDEKIREIIEDSDKYEARLPNAVPCKSIAEDMTQPQLEKVQIQSIVSAVDTGPFHPIEQLKISPGMKANLIASRLSDKTATNSEENQRTTVSRRNVGELPAPECDIILETLRIH